MVDERIWWIGVEDGLDAVFRGHEYFVPGTVAWKAYVDGFLTGLRSSGY